MNHTQSRQRIENLLTEVKRDLIVLKMRRPNMNPRVGELILDIDKYIQQLATETSNVFAEGQVANAQAHYFYNILLELYLEGFDVLGLEEVIESSEEEHVIKDFKAKFVELMEEISQFII